ncbi:hypothetical protein ABW48_22845 [Pluralibacter gergoviae]|nr:hypothetical protein ABW48_22845 [Pluralibacter gergoviae]
MKNVTATVRASVTLTISWWMVRSIVLTMASAFHNVVTTFSLISSAGYSNLHKGARYSKAPEN